MCNELTASGNGATGLFTNPAGGIAKALAPDELVGRCGADGRPDTRGQRARPTVALCAIAALFSHCLFDAIGPNSNNASSL
jgi:hypothetical protein